MSGPLTGLKVLDISTIVAAPLSGTLMADYGAEVVKVELPGVGDGLRGFPPQKDGKSLWWKAANRNKRFITLDLRTDEGRDLFLKLVAQFDVLLEGTLVASKGKFLRRVLVHGAPPQSELMASIERHLAVREGDACELPATDEGR